MATFIGLKVNKEEKEVKSKANKEEKEVKSKAKKEEIKKTETKTEKE